MIINLTQHPATPEQVAGGVVDLSGAALDALKCALTFDTLPNPAEVAGRARFIAGLVGGDSKIAAGLKSEAAMIGGAPFLMAPLVAALADGGVEALFAFSVRASTEALQEDGSVRKVAVFRHGGFVGAA